MSSRLAMRLFWALPALRDVAATAQGWRLHRTRYGELYQAAVPEIRQRDGWPPERMRAYVDERLRTVVNLAARHVPHYRETFARIGLHPEEVRGVADLPRLPILEKSEVRADAARFVSETIPRGQLTRGSTSGTTGSPLRLYKTGAVSQVNYAFFEARYRGPVGMEYGRKPYVMLGAKQVAPATRAKPPFWCYNHVGKQLYMSSYHLAERFLGYYVEEIRRRPYQAIMGFPSSLHAIARYILDSGVEPLRLGIALTGSEMLFEHQRRDIERGLGCRVFDQYGCAEYCVLAAEGPAGRMLVSPDYGILEVVDADGEPAPPGQVGDFVCTSLINDAQVFLRYRVGDRGALSPDRLESHPAFPVIQSLEGRANKALITRDGREITRLGPALSGVAHLKECQIVQDDWGVFRIRVVASPGFSTQDSEKLRKNLLNWIGDADVRVVVEDAIERTVGSKFETIVCNLTPEQRRAGPGSGRPR